MAGLSQGPLALSLAYCVTIILPTQFLIEQSAELHNCVSRCLLCPYDFHSEYLHVEQNCLPI